MLNPEETRFFAEKIKPLVRQNSDTSSKNILDIIDFIKRTAPNQPLTFSNGRTADYDNVLKELSESLSQTILHHGDDKWIITRMDKEM